MTTNPEIKQKAREWTLYFDSQVEEGFIRSKLPNGTEYNLMHENDEMVDVIEHSAYLALEEKYRRAVGELKQSKEAHLFSAKRISELNMQVHGDLHGCDCEGGCNCKPKLWYDLEELKYHCLGSDMGTEECLKQLGETKAEDGGVG